MNQKNVFTVMAAVLILQGIGFYFMGSKIVSDSFGDLGAQGNMASIALLQVMAALSINFGIIAYALRGNPQIVGPFALGFTILALVTFKHILVDHIKVPIWAVAIQVIFLLACVYFWMQGRKPQTA